jgi:hypothetical protein
MYPFLGEISIKFHSKRQQSLLYHVDSLETLARIQKEYRKGARLVLYYEPYPIKSEKFEDYYLIKLPYSRFRNEAEFAKTCFEVSTIDEVYRKLKGDPATVKCLKWDVSHVESNWRRSNLS